jgi:Holliday junction resolvasome RuvABC endonuclease subunit
MRSAAFQSKAERIDLLAWYLAKFSKIAKNTQWDLCIIEEYTFHNAQSRSVTIQAEVGGIIRACFAAYGVPILEVNTQTWKAITKMRLPKTSGYDKSQYLNKVREQFGLSFKTTDEADAYMMYWSVCECSRGHFVKGVGSKIRTRLEELGIEL